MGNKAEKDIRAAATSKIWGMATGMLAICIPLSAITRSGAILPLAVISGATIGTVVVWRDSERGNKRNAELINNAKKLEERVANLEIICSNEELDLRKRLKQLESKG
ncbi:hypothetical protein [Argonema antarcticum]|uniref:hypothetical protein n=1 Tax=Argonema antarcticum TaxID=2942763 RepID=UPI0020111BA6|nr:hypothetical protein [Argonema antarcticum]MCL1469326.1 hypothetical protein [Argonema antarcticum A004/B2]